MIYGIPGTQEFETLAINILPGFRLFRTAGGDCIQMPTAWKTSMKGTFPCNAIIQGLCTVYYFQVTRIDSALFTPSHFSDHKHHHICIEGTLEKQGKEGETDSEKFSLYFLPLSRFLLTESTC